MDNKIKTIYKNINVDNSYIRKVTGLNYTESSINGSINKSNISNPIKFIGPTNEVKNRSYRLQCVGSNRRSDAIRANLKIKQRLFYNNLILNNQKNIK